MSPVRGWQLSVDWSGGGGFTGPLEDVSSYLNRDDVTVTEGRTTDSVSLTTPTSQIDFALRNRDRAWDRYFSPENVSSPIYGKVLPGKVTQFSKTVRGSTILYSESAFTTSLGGWSAVSGGTLTRVPSPSEDGDGSLQYVPPGAVATVGVARLAYTDILTQPDGQYVLSFRALATVTHADAAAAIDWYNQAGGLVSTTTGPTVSLAAGVWTSVASGLLTPPATAVRLQMRLRLGSTPPNTTTFRVDSVLLTSQPYDADRTYVLHAGILDDLSVDSTGAARTVSATALDAWGRPDSAQLSTQVYQSIRTGTAIGLILDAAGWTGPRAIDVGATVIPYWWEEGTDPGEAVDKIVRSEGPPSIAYVEAGTFVFRDRHHRIRGATSSASQGLYSLITPAGSGPGYDLKVERDTFTYDHGLKSIVNTATFNIDQRFPQNIQEVWASEDPIAMNSGEVQVLFAQPSDPVINVVTPSMAGGEIVAGVGTFTATIGSTSGQKIIITLTCTSTGTVTRIALNGNPIPVVRSTQVSSVDTGSVARYGTSSWPDDVAWAGKYDAQAIADKIVSVYADNRPRVTFTVVAFNDRYASKMLAMRVGDRITVRNDILGVNRDFHVEHLEHTVSRLTLHRLTVQAISVEATQPANVLTFGVAGKGFDDGAFGANGVDSATGMFLFDSGTQGFNVGQFAT